jgi:regulator of sirC expression with transglutaminase-like and TPR domain
MSDRLDAFRALFAEGEPELARACLMVAQDAYPELDVERYLGEFNRLAEDLRKRLPPNAGVEERVLGLNQFLFEELAYRGNADDYYDPRNSYLNDVLDRRIGIPITLSVVYMELGRKIGLPLEGVSFPGHFLVRLRLRRGMLVLDPFAAGVPLAADELRARLQRVVPEKALGSLSVAELPLEHFLDPATPRQILARLLRNLKGIHREAGRAERVLEVLDRMLIVTPDASTELRDRGYAYRQLECWRPALQDLTAYIEREPQAQDLDAVRAQIVELSALCARLN